MEAFFQPYMCFSLTLTLSQSGLLQIVDNDPAILSHHIVTLITGHSRRHLGRHSESPITRLTLGIANEDPHCRQSEILTASWRSASGTRKGVQQSPCLTQELSCRIDPQKIMGFHIHGWAELVDLGGLQTLKLTAPVALCGLDKLSSLHLPAVKPLSFRCWRRPVTVYFEKVKRFLARLPRLRTL